MTETTQTTEMPQTTVEVKWTSRPNQWNVATDIIKTIETTKLIIAPGYYGSERCAVDASGNIVRRLDIEPGPNPKSMAYIFLDLVEQGDYVLVFENGNKENALLVRITSVPYMRSIPAITLYKREGYTNEKYESNHDYRPDGHIEKLSNHVEVCLTGQRKTASTDTDTSSTMVAFVRDIEVIRYVSADEQIFKTYNKTSRASIRRAISEDRFVSLA